MAIKFSNLSAKVPEETIRRFEEILKKTKGTKSLTVRKLVEAYISEHSRPLYGCDGCSKVIGKNELYYCKLINRERIKMSRKGERVISPEDSVTHEIMCEKCARKRGYSKYFTGKRKEPSHEMHEMDRVLRSRRRT